MNETNSSSLGLATTSRSGELAATAMAAKAQAIVQARYVMAFNKPRNIEQARIDILNACKRPTFAMMARYKKPVGGGAVVGYSIRFAEEAIKAMKNIATESTVIYEDDDQRTVQISVTDLESNVSYGKEVTVKKTVERRSLKEGQVAISQRQNSQGQITYLVEATEDDIANKIASAESKIIRNCGLRLVPSDILEEAQEQIKITLSVGGGDVNAESKKIADAFSMLRVSPTELEKYLGHSLSTVSPAELDDLRLIYSAVKEGEASWNDFLEKKDKPLSKPASTEQVSVDTDKKVGDLKAATETAAPATTAAPAQEPTKPKKRAAPKTIDVAVSDTKEQAQTPEPQAPPKVTEPPKETAQVEQQEQAPPAEVESAQDPSLAEGSPVMVLAEKLQAINVSFVSFKKWAKTRDPAMGADKWNDFQDVPPAFATTVANDERVMRKIQLLCGS